MRRKDSTDLPSAKITSGKPARRWRSKSNWVSPSAAKVWLAIVREMFVRQLAANELFRKSPKIRLLGHASKGNRNGLAMQEAARPQTPNLKHQIPDKSQNEIQMSKTRN